MTEKNRKGRWLLPTALILFILEIITLPLIFVLTYAGRAERPQHLLTFADKKLTWDEDTVLNEDGSARLSFFSQVYQNVHSENEDNVFAPGTDQITTIRLKNASSDTITYTAVAYMIKESDVLPLYGKMESPGSVPTAVYTLPEGVSREQVIGAVTGTVESKGIQDFDIDWYWTFYVDDYQDIVDTGLGNKAAWETADDAVIGFFIIVEGEDGPINPTPPGTGAKSMIGWGIALISISAAVLVFAIIRRVREKRMEQKNAPAAE